MSSISSYLGRSTTLMNSRQLLASLRRTQGELAKAQLAITTGQGVNKPSDSPGNTAAILLLTRQLESREQQDRNLNHAVTLLNNVDAGLADASDILIDARGLASSQAGLGSDSQTRR